jgi:hypothetical protein
MTESIIQYVPLNMRDYGQLLVTRDQGEKVRNHLMHLLHEHEYVEIILDDVDAYTPSFVDEVLGKCMLELGTDKFRKAIRLICQAPEVRKLVNLVLSNRTTRESV